MKRNTSGQIIGVQMVSSTDGSAFTSTVSALVTKDGGTQTAGGGSVTHEGNGFHSYTITQSETDADHVAVTFTGTGAVPATVQVYTSFPQTGDAFARLGAPVGASISADVAAVQADTDNIQTRLPTSLVSGRIDASLGAIASGVDFSATMKASINTEADTALSDVGLTSTVTGRIDAAVSTRSSQTSVDTLAGYVDNEVAAIKAKTDNLPASPAATGDIPSASSIADAVWDEALSGHTTAGSAGKALADAGNAGDPWSTAVPGAYGAGTAGKILGDYLDAAVSSRASQTSLDTLDDYVDTEVAAIKAKTDLIPASPAAVSDIPSASSIADAVWDEAVSGHTSAGTTGLALRDADLRGSRTVIRGTVGTSTTPSTTQFTPSAISPAGAAVDQFKGRIVIFDNDTATAALRGQATDITGNSSAATPLFTFTALTTAPADGDTFSIV